MCGGLVGGGDGTDESRGFKDNQWGVKNEVAICLDHRACCAVLIPPQLLWSAHILSIHRDKTPSERSATTHFSIQHGLLRSPGASSYRASHRH